ncbi:MAG: hypothetical protein ACI4BC_05430 [Muribaculaceae bacterium]
MKHLFTLKSLMLTLVMLFGLNAWGETETFNFVNWGFDGGSTGWSSSYAKHEVNGSAYKVTFSGASKQSQTITDRPVNKNSDIDVSPLSSDVTITGIGLVLTRWNSKGQTVTLNVSSDGTSFTATSTTSSEFSLSASELTDTKAVKFTFSSSNQVGVASITVTYEAATVAVKAPVITETSTPDFGSSYYTTSTATATITRATEGAAIKYAITDGAEPTTWSDYNAEVPITSEAAGTKTLWAKAVKDADESAVVKQEFSFVASIANTKETALTTAQAIALIDATSAEQLAAEKVYVKGVISKIDSYNSTYKSITYWLDNNAFEVYSGKGIDGADFAAKTDIEVKANVVVYGNIKKYNSTYEFDMNNYLVEYTVPVVTLESLEISGTPSKTSYVDGSTFDPAGLSVIGTYSDASTADVTSSVAWTFVPATLTLGTTQVVATATYEEKSVSKTIDVTVFETIQFEQVTSESQIVPGRKYVIACTNAAKMAVMNVIESGDDFFSAVNSNVSYEDNKLNFANGDAVYVTFEKAAASFANGHANDKATTIWNVKIGDEYITQTAVKKMAMSATAPTNVSLSIDAEGYLDLKFGANYFCYNSSSPRFTTYASTQTKIKLFREPEAMASVMSAAAETAVELPVSVVGRKVFGNYLLASTVNNGGAQLESPSLEEAKHFWSNDPEKFNQESWIAIAGLDESYVGKEFEVGQTLTAAGADATYGFPTYTVATPSTSDYAGALEINDFSASNFNIGGTDESVANVWLVAPQLGEYCQIHGYVDASLADASTALVQANETSNVTATVYLNGLSKFTTSGWYNIEGVVAKDSEGLAIYATAVDTATGVEGVEASSVKVYGAEGVINVVSEEVAPIAVYSANGAIVSSVEASSASIAVAPGFYIVKAGNSVQKVTVK